MNWATSLRSKPSSSRKVAPIAERRILPHGKPPKRTDSTEFSFEKARALGELDDALTPYRLQGDAAWDEPDAAARREALRAETFPDFRRAAKAYFGAIGLRGDELMSREQYFAIHLKMAQALAPELSRWEAYRVAQQDWAEDARRTPEGTPAPRGARPRLDGVSLDQFAHALWSLADVWTAELSAHEYVAFTSKLFRRITQEVEWQRVVHAAAPGDKDGRPRLAPIRLSGTEKAGSLLAGGGAAAGASDGAQSAAAAAAAVGSAPTGAAAASTQVVPFESGGVNGTGAGSKPGDGSGPGPTPTAPSPSSTAGADGAGADGSGADCAPLSARAHLRRHSLPSGGGAAGEGEERRASGRERRHSLPGIPIIITPAPRALGEPDTSSSSSSSSCDDSDDDVGDGWTVRRRAPPARPRSAAEAAAVLAARRRGAAVTRSGRDIRIVVTRAGADLWQLARGRLACARVFTRMWRAARARRTPPLTKGCAMVLLPLTPPAASATSAHASALFSTLRAIRSWEPYSAHAQGGGGSRQRRGSAPSSALSSAANSAAPTRRGSSANLAERGTARRRRDDARRSSTGSMDERAEPSRALAERRARRGSSASATSSSSRRRSVSLTPKTSGQLMKEYHAKRLEISESAGTSIKVFPGLEPWHKPVSTPGLAPPSAPSSQLPSPRRSSVWV